MPALRLITRERRNAGPGPGPGPGLGPGPRPSEAPRPARRRGPKDVGKAGRSQEPCRLILGDALLVAPLLEAEIADLVYLDPPFATGRSRRGAKSPSASSPPLEFGDRWEGGLGGYLDWLAALLVEARRLLARSGSLVLHLDYRAAPAARLLLDAIFGPERFLGEIIWHYGSGGRASRHFHRKHDTLLWYSKGPDYRFFPEAVSVPRSRCPACGRDRANWNHMRRRTDETGRAYRSIRSAGREYRYYDDERVLSPDVWQDISHLQQRDPERVGWPTQKPLALMGRLVAAFTLPGDLVADLTAGSGTTLAAAQAGARRFLGVEVSPEAAALAWRRLGDASDAAHPSLLESCGVEGWGEGGESLASALRRGSLAVSRGRPRAGHALALVTGLLGG